jgi:hypothetical protein
MLPGQEGTAMKIYLLCVLMAAIAVSAHLPILRARGHRH